MSTLSDEEASNVSTLGERSLYRWLDEQDAGWQELPDEREFAGLEYAPKRKRLSRIGAKLHSFLSKRRRYAYQAV